MGKIKTKDYTLKDGLRCNIAELTAEDAAEMVEYMKQVTGETDKLAYGPEEFTMTVEQETEFLESQVQSKHSVMIAARVEGKIVGCLGFQGSNRKRTEHTGIFGISVMKEYWGIGIGKLLLESLISFAEDTGVTKINLKVRTDNIQAIALYEKMGFQIEGRERWGIKIDGVYYDFYLMGLIVD